MNRKPILYILPFLFLGCSKSQISNKASNSANTQKESRIEMPKLPTQKELETTSSDDEIRNQKIDIDMTKMSATMIYAQVFDMIVMPEIYADKILKVKGFFDVFTSENSSERYYAIIIPDATACCKQGIDFIWPGNHSYPSDFPEKGQEIIITGKYTTYETDEGLTYNYITVNKLKK